MRETGIPEEIRLENKRRKPYLSFPVSDTVLWEKLRFQSHLTAFLNTNMDDIWMNAHTICILHAIQALLKFHKKRLTFGFNLSREIMPPSEGSYGKNKHKGIPEELAGDYASCANTNGSKQWAAT